MEFCINDGEKSCNLVVVIVGKEMGECSGVLIMGNVSWGALVLTLDGESFTQLRLWQTYLALQTHLACQSVGDVIVGGS